MKELQKKFISEIAQTVSSVIDRVKFDGSLSLDEVKKLRFELDGAKASLGRFVDINLETKETALLSQCTDLLEKSLNALSGNHLL